MPPLNQFNYKSAIHRNINASAAAPPSAHGASPWNTAGAAPVRVATGAVEVGVCDAVLVLAFVFVGVAEL